MKVFNYKKRFSVDNLNREFEFLSQKITEFKLPEGFQQFVLYVISKLFDKKEFIPKMIPQPLSLLYKYIE